MQMCRYAVESTTMRSGATRNAGLTLLLGFNHPQAADAESSSPVSFLSMGQTNLSIAYSSSIVHIPYML